MHDVAVVIPVAVAAVSLRLLAQVTPGAPILDPGISSLLGNVGVVGVLIWHLWYHTTRSYPEMIRQFSVEQEKTRQAFIAEKEKTRLAFITEQEKTRQAFASEQDAIRRQHERERAEIMAMHIQSLQAMRTAVHDVKNTAQQAITHADIAMRDPSKLKREE